MSTHVQVTCNNAHAQMPRDIQSWPHRHTTAHTSSHGHTTLILLHTGSPGTPRPKDTHSHSLPGAHSTHQDNKHSCTIAERHPNMLTSRNTWVHGEAHSNSHEHTSTQISHMHTGIHRHSHSQTQTQRHRYLGTHI